MCDCIEKLNKQMAESNYNAVVSQAIGIHGIIPNAIVLTEKLDKDVKRKPLSMFATFCPFCGEQYPEMNK